jgi:hypothetical protein
LWPLQRTEEFRKTLLMLLSGVDEKERLNEWLRPKTIQKAMLERKRRRRESCEEANDDDVKPVSAVSARNSTIASIGNIRCQS